MAHIPDGVLSAPVLLTGGVIAAGLLAHALRRVGPREVPRVAIMAAMFFIASLIMIPLGPTSVHPLLAGLMGLVLGWGVVPAVTVGLLLQAIFFGFGGLTALGVNVVNIALPGLVAGLLLGPVIRKAAGTALASTLAACVGAAAVAGTALMVTLVLTLSSGDFHAPARLIALTYAPLMVVEGLVTSVAFMAVLRMRPDLVAAPLVRSGA
jgi:cobalt/nickel transport system permease protein